jgi:thymidylate synthase
VIETANQAWIKLLDEILKNGSDVRSRGFDHTEVIKYRAEVDMAYPVITIRPRSLGYKFMAAEAAAILSGDNRVAALDSYSKTISQYSDDGLFFMGSYGPKVVDQLPYIIHTLLEDQGSRQAVMTLWRERPGKSLDIPCTLAIQWLIRDKKLICIDDMRSSDAILGWPYDIFTFSMISGFIMKVLTTKGYDWLKLGHLVITAGSQHIYDKDLKMARTCVASRDDFWTYDPFQPETFATPDGIIKHLRGLAEHNVHKLQGKFLWELTRTWED